MNFGHKECTDTVFGNQRVVGYLSVYICFRPTYLTPEKKFSSRTRKGKRKESVEDTLLGRFTQSFLQ